MSQSIPTPPRYAQSESPLTTLALLVAAALGSEARIRYVSATARLQGLAGWRADFLKSIPEDLRAIVKGVCTDLYDGFINAAAEVLPYAKVVGDRFHVAKLYRATLDDLRKKEMKELKRILDKQEYAGLKGAL